MPEYHLLQNGENDEEVANPSSIGANLANPKLYKWISALACFLFGCIFTMLSLVAGSHIISNKPAFAEDLSLLSAFLEEEPAIRIVAD